MTLTADREALAASVGGSRNLDAQDRRMEFAVEGVTCPACMSKIERGVKDLPGVSAVRFNLTNHRLTVQGQADVFDSETLMERIDSLGYTARPFEIDALELEEKERERMLLRSLAVAGFAAGNIMMLSIPVWAGNISGIATETRALFHWVSALIALPAVAYAGQPFFQSAFAALRKRQLNMDVPISLAVILALVMSVIQTASHARDAYFDSAVMLLFFLLIGRYLDFRSRKRTRDLGQNLLALQKPTVTKIMPDGNIKDIPSVEIHPGDTILVPAGVRIGVDGVVLSGTSQIDTSLITGESAPREAQTGTTVYAGTLNLSGALHVEAQATIGDTLLAEISNLMDKATEKRGSYVRLADWAASLYAPVVHLLALATFLGWLAIGAGWQTSLLTAIAVLIITCPCALGLAVPVVQVVATGSLFRSGILVNSGDALERMAVADTVVFDKTGTLTEPDPAIINGGDIPAEDLALAARLAHSSHHVLAKTLARTVPESAPLAGATEVAGQGVEATLDGVRMRLGSRAFCSVPEDAPLPGHGLSEDLSYSEMWFQREGRVPQPLLFSQRLKVDAQDTISRLRGLGVNLLILSGDKTPAVRNAAAALGITDYFGETTPEQKIAKIEALRDAGHSVLMVGDGLNDAAALQMANVSAAPASALDITQAAADVIIIGNRLKPLATAIVAARKARQLMLQNFAFAAVYNAIAIPLAVLGWVTPLLAALFMSGSSIIVTLNALRAHTRTDATTNTDNRTTGTPGTAAAQEKTA